MSKNKHSIVYLPIAVQDIEELFDYIKLDSPKNAAQVLKRFDTEISKLAEFPLLGSTIKDPFIAALGYRVLVIEPFLVFYIVADNNVEIRRILHGSRQYIDLLQ